MPAPPNIIKYNQEADAELRKANASKAGKASVEARRERKTLANELKLLLAQGDNQERLCIALLDEALKGNYKAFCAIRDTIGEMPTSKTEITADIMTDSDRALIDKVSRRLKCK